MSCYIIEVIPKEVDEGTLYSATAKKEDEVIYGPVKVIIPKQNKGKFNATNGVEEGQKAIMEALLNLVNDAIKFRNILPSPEKFSLKVLL